MKSDFFMEVGRVYDAAFSRGRYEIDYAKGVKCIKITPKSYRVERKDGTTFLIEKGSFFDLKEVNRT